MGDVTVNSLEENSENRNLEEFLVCFNITRLQFPPNTNNPSDLNINRLGLHKHWRNQNLHKWYANRPVWPHFPGSGTWITPIKQNGPKENRRHFSRNATDLFKSNLKLKIGKQFYQSEDINQAYSIFHGIIKFTLVTACPFITIHHKPKTAKLCRDTAECTRLKSAFIEALERELCSGALEDKIVTAAKKQEYNTKLKNFRKQKLRIGYKILITNP